MIELDVLSATLHADSKRVDLPPREFAVFMTLALAPRVWPSYQLIPLLWPGAAISKSSCLKVYVHRLRKRLGQNVIISTNRGYELDRTLAVDLWRVHDIVSKDQLGDAEREYLLRFVNEARAVGREFLTRWPWFGETEKLIQREIRAASARLEADARHVKRGLGGRRRWMLAGGATGRRIGPRQAAV